MSNATGVLALPKAALRSSMRATLAKLPRDDILAQSHSIARHLLSHPRFLASRAVGCFLSMPAAELDTAAIVSAILDGGKSLFVPRIADRAASRMDLLRVYDAADLRTLPAGRWGLREPAVERDGAPRPSALDGTAEPLDLIILPGVAFDRAGARIGYGKGYYDRFLSAYVPTASPRPLLVGLALREQILEAGQVPMEEGADWRADVVIGPDGIVHDH